MEKGEYDRTIDDFNTALKLKPDHDLATYNRGVAESDKRQYALAVEGYTRYIALKPSDPDGYDSRGNAYRREGQFEQAIADYNHALQLNRDTCFLTAATRIFWPGKRARLGRISGLPSAPIRLWSTRPCGCTW
jgi:tetratricopeptide (TPR) repeat protein